MSRIQIVAFDGDDTLWHNERLYAETQGKLRTLLARYHSPEWVDERLYQTEMRNLQHFGYGIKSFALSMIEAAVELTEGRVSASEVHAIIGWAKEMLSADTELLPHAAETVAALSGAYPLMLVTKGDLLDQEAKIARSGLGPHFRHVEIVSDKTRKGYEALLRRHGIATERFLMVGNSLRSDILPVMAIGGTAVHVPHDLNWAHEVVEPPPVGTPGFHALAHLGQLPALVERLERIA